MIDFSTMTMRADEGREAWKDQLAALCGRAATLSFQDRGFEASIRTRDVGGISIGRFRHNMSEIIHHEGARSGARCQHMMLIMQVGGRLTLSQGGLDTRIGPTELALVDTYRPFVSRFEGPTSQLVAYLPAAELSTRCSASTFARPQRWSGRHGIGGLVRSALTTIARSADGLRPGDAIHARQVLIGAVKHLVERDRLPSAEPDQVLPDPRIRAFIDAHLADPDLGPVQIASGCGLSLRRLHRSFVDSQWSVCGWIRHRRLAKCREDLLDPSQRHLSITQIAFRWGFNDAAHFSRSFRDAYQQSAREARRQLVQ